MATSRSQPVGRPLLTFQIPDRHGFAATEPSTTACESTPGLAVQINRTGTATTLVLVGELDIATAGLVREALDVIEREGPDRLVIDLRRLSFMDSTGLHLIVSEQARRQRYGATALEIRRGPRAVQQVFRLVGLETQLPFSG